MNRRNVFAAIAGLFGGAAARAQQWKACVPRKGVWEQPEGLNDYKSFCSDKFMPALKDQCPVCGTMASPARGDTHPTDEGRRLYVGIYGLSAITRCMRCNAAFWQDWQ